MCIAQKDLVGHARKQDAGPAPLSAEHTAA